VSDIDADEEDLPDVVPITKGVNNERREDTDSSGVSDIDVDDYGSSSDAYDSDELDLDTTANPHGFVFSNMLETYQKSRLERIDEMRDGFDKQTHRDKFKKKRASKKIGKSEKVHQKNKPFMMMKKKKIGELREKMCNNKPTKKNGNKKRVFTGHFRKSTQQRITAKKKKM